MNGTYPPAGKPSEAPAGPGAPRAGAAPGPGRACCCVANPVVRVIIPATAGRPHDTDLLLCGHHYRVSRQVLTAADAQVEELDGSAGEQAAWFNGREDWLAEAARCASR